MKENKKANKDRDKKEKTTEEKDKKKKEPQEPLHDEEENEFGGFPDRDLKKSLGCGG